MSTFNLEKIGLDNQTTVGLTGTLNSLPYRVTEIERHIHGRERWYGKLAVQTATDWASDVINNPFVAKSGNNAYGTDANDEALVFGTADTPMMTDLVTGLPNAKFDLHQLLITDCTVTTPAKIRLVYGTGTIAAAIAAGQFSTMMVRIDAAVGSNPAVPLDLMMPRGTCGSTQVWIQFWSITNDATISFYVGMHEYEG
jgi:hypothetical protein